MLNRLGRNGLTVWFSFRYISRLCVWFKNIPYYQAPANKVTHTRNILIDSGQTWDFGILDRVCAVCGLRFPIGGRHTPCPHAIISNFRRNYSGMVKHIHCDNVILCIRIRKNAQLIIRGLGKILRININCCVIR